jgi:hypothetical protein
MDGSCSDTDSQQGVVFPLGGFSGYNKKSKKGMREGKLDLVGEQEVRWDNRDTEPADYYIFFCGKRNGSYQSER